MTSSLIWHWCVQDVCFTLYSFFLCTPIVFHTCRIQYFSHMFLFHTLYMSKPLKICQATNYINPHFLDVHSTPHLIVSCSVPYGVTGHFTVGFFAVGHFSVGPFAVRTLRRKDIWPLDISPYDFFAAGRFAVFFAVRTFCRRTYWRKYFVMRF